MTADNLSRRGVSKPQECQFLWSMNPFTTFYLTVWWLSMFGSCTTSSLVFILAIILIWLVNGCVKKKSLNNSISAGVYGELAMTAFNNQFGKDLKVAIRKIWLVMVDWKLMFSGNLEQGMDQWFSYLEVARKTPLAMDC